MKKWLWGSSKKPSFDNHKFEDLDPVPAIPATILAPSDPGLGFTHPMEPCTIRPMFSASEPAAPGTWEHPKPIAVWLLKTINKWRAFFGCRIVFGICFPQVLVFFAFLSRYHLPCICNSLELEPVLHGICYILAWSLCILHGICYIWPRVAFHFAWYLSHFGISTSQLHGICYILVLQTFMWVSWGFFRLSFKDSFKVSLRVSFRVLFKASFGASFRVSFRVSFRISFRVSFGFHLGFHLI